MNHCTFSKVAAYLVSGTLPGKDNYSPLEAGPWNITLSGTLEANLANTGLSKIRRNWELGQLHL